MASKESEQVVPFRVKVFFILIIAILVWLIGGNVQAQEVREDSTCFVFERAGTELTIYACDEGQYRVTIMKSGRVVSGGVLENGIPCPIFFFEPGSECYIRDDKTHKLLFKAVL